MKPDINFFRQNALDNIDNHADDMTPYSLVTPKIGGWLIILLLFVSSFLIWCLFGKIELHINADGVLLSEKYIIESESMIDKYVKEYDQQLKLIQQILEQKIQLYQRHLITVDQLISAKNEFFTAKERIADPAKYLYSHSSWILHDNLSGSNDTMLAILFVDFLHGKDIKAGDIVRIKRYRNNVYFNNDLTGSVVSVSKYPIKKQIAYAYLDNINLVDKYFINGSPYLVKIKFDNSHHYDEFEEGEPVQGNIIYAVSKPYHLMFDL